MKAKALSCLIVFAVFGILTLNLQAQNYSTCDQWGSWSVNGYTIYNNIWGAVDGSVQCLWAYDEGNWGVWANHPNTSGIKSYPNVSLTVNYTVSSMPNITSTFSVTRPGSGSYNTAYDIWYNNYAYEIMLWMNWNGEMGPISYNYGCSGYPSTACPVQTNVNVGGHTWNLYAGSNGSATVYSFLRTSNTNSGTVDIKAISQWLANNSYFSSSVNLHQIQFGWEISQSSGGLDFSVNDYDVTIGGGGGGGIVSGSTYYIYNQGSGKCIDVYGNSTSNGANIIQWTYHGGSNQQWQVNSTGDGYYTLTAQHSGKLMDVSGASTANGANVLQWSYNGGTNQQWAIADQGDGSYKLTARHSGKCLDLVNGSTADGANIQQYTDNGTSAQRWEFVLVGSSKPIAEEKAAPAPEDFSLAQNYPNPFNPETEIGYYLKDAGSVRLEIFNILGHKVKTLVNDYKSVGQHSIAWNGRDESDVRVPSGIYFYSINVSTDNGAYSATRKMLLEK